MPTYTRKVGRTVDPEVEARKMERQARKEWLEREARERALIRRLHPPNSKAARARRDFAFKRNRDKFGEKKARYIAWIICQRQKGNFWEPSERAEARTIR